MRTERQTSRRPASIASPARTIETPQIRAVRVARLPAAHFSLKRDAVECVAGGRLDLLGHDRQVIEALLDAGQ